MKQPDSVRNLTVKLELITMSTRTLADLRRERLDKKIAGLKRKLQSMEWARVPAADN